MQNTGFFKALVAVAAAGWQGFAYNTSNLLDRYKTRRGSSTIQFDTGPGGYLKHPPGTVAQARRAATKTKNRAKHRAACRG